VLEDIGVIIFSSSDFGKFLPVMFANLVMEDDDANCCGYILIELVCSLQQQLGEIMVTCRSCAQGGFSSFISVYASFVLV
jgi:hypothetical protein